jgi:hypothetical protein
MVYTEKDMIRAVPGFPSYGVSRFGRFFNNKTGTEMTLSEAQNGDLSVGLMKEGVQYRRSAKLLVAKAFVEGRNELFDTPILLDGDRFNLHVENIAWRPRWFAWKYHRQFTQSQDYYSWGPVLEVTRRQIYDNIFDASTQNGLLCSDVVGSISADTYVFPGNLKFVYVER